MSKVIRVLSNEENIDFDDILSFRTKDFLGLWDYESERYVLLHQDCSELYLNFIPTDSTCYNLEQLDSKVFEICGQNILEVFDSSKYKIDLIIEEE